MENTEKTKITYTTVWEPQKGPQTWLLTCPVFEVLFGGARGGGKSDAILGEWASHASEYNENAIGLCVRRERTQLTELIERSKIIYTPLGANFHEQDKMWRFPNGARLKFAYLENDSDALSYQGHSYCVEQSTKIKMADGTLKEIRHIKVGEYVKTLMGAKRVLHTVKPYTAPCVSAIIKDQNKVQIGRHIHPVWHPVLTNVGVICKHKTPKLYDYAISEREKFLKKAGKVFHRETDLGNKAWYAFSKDGNSSYKEYRHLFEEKRRLGLMSVPVVLHSQFDRLAVEKLKPVYGKKSTLFHSLCRLFQPVLEISQRLKYSLKGLLQKFELFLLTQGYSYLCLSNDFSYAQNGRKISANSQYCYHFGHSLYDLFFPNDLKSDLNKLHILNDAENKRHEKLLDELDTILEYSPLSQQLWVHPYTGQVHDLLESVVIGTMEVQDIVDAYVCDLSIADANHYISEYGIIEANTRVYVEEMGTFANPDPIFKLMATLRSGGSVPCRFVATANPGGPGHLWIKKRYIDPNPSGMQVLPTMFKNPFTGEDIKKERIFIPSKVTDNKYTNNAEYIGSLYLSGNEELVKAWLLGDWNVTLGAFFSEWTTSKHVIKTFTVPKHWTRFISADWGSATPFSIGWWTIAPDEFDSHLDIPYYNLAYERIIIPRGALIRYREWYGNEANLQMEKGIDITQTASENLYNKGIKYTAEQVANGINIREAGEPKNINGLPKIAYRVIDPRAFAHDSGPSIVERMGVRPYRLVWQRADNKRTGKTGNLGGWDQVRARLKGDGNVPMMYFMDCCKDSIRTLPAVQHDPDNLEDVEQGEDHAPDEIRYACMSRPFVNAPEVDDFRAMIKKKDNGIVLHDILEDFEPNRKYINQERIS